MWISPSRSGHIHLRPAYIWASLRLSIETMAMTEDEAATEMSTTAAAAAATETAANTMVAAAGTTRTEGAAGVAPRPRTTVVGGEARAMTGPDRVSAPTPHVVIKSVLIRTCVCDVMPPPMSTMFSQSADTHLVL